MVPDAIRFYAGAPLVTSGGHRVGMLCVADAAPRAGFDAQAAAILANMAELVMREMELAASAALMHERQVPDSFSWHFSTINTGREGAVSRGACAAAAARLCPVQHTGCCEGPLLEPGRRAGRGSRRACRRRRRPVALPARACPAGDRHALHSAGAPGRKSPGRKSRSWGGGVQATRWVRSLEALEAPYLFVEADAAGGAWRVLHANAPAAAALGEPGLALPAPLWDAFTAVGLSAEVRRRAAAPALSGGRLQRLLPQTLPVTVLVSGAPRVAPPCAGGGGAAGGRGVERGRGRPARAPPRMRGRRRPRAPAAPDVQARAPSGPANAPCVCIGAPW